MNGHRMRLRAFVASFVLASVLLPCAASVAQAESGAVLPVSQEGGIPMRNDFQVSPTRFVLDMDPGEERTIQISIISRSGEPYTFSTNAEDFAADEREDIVLFGDKDGPFSARAWVYPAMKSVQLNHGQRATIPVTIKVPDNAAVGDHYVAVLFQRDPKKGPEPGFNIMARVGVLLLITVKGPMVRQGQLEQFKSLLPMYWWLPATLRLQYRNEGTVHLIPSGSVQIKNIFGITVDEIPVKDWFVLRNSTRSRLITWQPRFALGYYRATVMVKTAANPDVEQLSTSFWVIPVIPVAFALIAIFFVSFVVQIFFSRFEIRTKKKKK